MDEVRPARPSNYGGCRIVLSCLMQRTHWRHKAKKNLRQSLTRLDQLQAIFGIFAITFAVKSRVSIVVL